MKLKVKIGCDTCKRRIRLKSKVQGSRFEHHCLVGNQQELGDGQGRLKIRNTISKKKKKEILSQLSREVFLSAIQRGVWSMRPRNLPCVQRSRQRTDVVIHGWHS